MLVVPIHCPQGMRCSGPRSSCVGKLLYWLASSSCRLPCTFSIIKGCANRMSTLHLWMSSDIFGLDVFGMTLPCSPCILLSKHKRAHLLATVSLRLHLARRPKPYQGQIVRPTPILSKPLVLTYNRPLLTISYCNHYQPSIRH